MQNRGTRRHHAERVKNWAYRVEKFWWRKEQEPTARQVGRRAVTPAFCSRYCCGNVRRQEKGKRKLTRQELLAMGCRKAN